MTKIRMIMPFSMLKPCRTLTQLRPVVQQKIMLGDLTAVTDNGAETKTIADGTWHLKFKLEADNSAVELPAGQSIQVGGKTATINKVLSLAYRL